VPSGKRPGCVMHVCAFSSCAPRTSTATQNHPQSAQSQPSHLFLLVFHLFLLCPVFCVLCLYTVAGICHSDIHQAREEWGPAIFPMVPGHGTCFSASLLSHPLCCVNTIWCGVNTVMCISIFQCIYEFVFCHIL